MVNIESLFGEEFLKFIEEQQVQGKSISDIAAEQNKTYEAIRSKIKREKQKVKKGIVTKNIRNKEIQNSNKDIKKNNIIPVDINTKNIEEKLDFIINLLKNSNEKDNAVQNVSQSVQLDVQHKKNSYTKTSMRVDSDIWTEFLEFCKTKKDSYKQQDIISLALKEFLEKYK